MRTIVFLSGLALLGTSGCENLAQSMAESAVEAATDGQVKVDIDKDGKKVTIKTKDGEVTTIAAEGEDGARAVVTGADGEKVVLTSGKDVPADFPLPILEGAEVMSSTQMKQNGGAMYNVTFKTDKLPGEVADFYAKALEKKGMKANRNTLESGKDLTVMINAQSKEARVMVNLARKDKEPKTTVLLNWVKK